MTRTMLLLVAGATLLLGGLPLTRPATAVAQQPADLAALVSEAYAKTKAAKTIGEYTDIASICERAAEVPGGDPKQLAYLKQLHSWSLNRRGEALSDQAAEAEGDQATALETRALRDFIRAVELDPTRWRAVHNRGVSYAMTEKFDQAIADFTRTVELKPEYANAWFNRGEIYYEMGQYEKAIRDYGEVIRLRPEDAGAYTSRGHALFQQRRYKDALQDYHRVTQLTPGSGDGFTDRGDAYQSLQTWEQAAADYRRAISINNRSSRAYQSAAWLMATCPDQRYRNPSLALQAAERSLELAGKEDGLLLDTLAAAQANAGKFAEAQASIQRAIKLAGEPQPEMKKRLALYQANQPYRQSAPSSNR